MNAGLAYAGLSGVAVVVLGLAVHAIWRSLIR